MLLIFQIRLPLHSNQVLAIESEPLLMLPTAEEGEKFLLFAFIQLPLSSFILGDRSSQNAKTWLSGHINGGKERARDKTGKKGANVRKSRKREEPELAVCSD